MDRDSQLLAARAWIERMCRHPADGKDLFQDVWIKCRTTRSTVDWSIDRGGLLRTIAKRILIDRSRKAKTLELLEEEGCLDWGKAPCQPIDEGDVVDHMLRLLSPDDRDLINQVVLQGRTCREIAAAMNLSINTVGTRFKRARERLRRAFVYRQRRTDPDSASSESTSFQMGTSNGRVEDPYVQ